MDDLTAALTAIIRPIVDGQLRTFAHGHPTLVAAVDWDHSGKSKLDTLVDSAAKRVSRALLCPETVAWLRSAINDAGKSDAG